MYSFGSSGLALEASKIFVRPYRAMNSESGFIAIDAPTEGGFVFRCINCNYIETDSEKLQWRLQMGAALLLCGFIAGH